MEKRWHSNRRGKWGISLLEAVPISLFVLGLFYYWFAVANRYVIFLYGHTAHGIPQTQPFDIGLQLLVVGVGAGLAIGVSPLRRRLPPRLAPKHSGIPGA